MYLHYWDLPGFQLNVINRWLKCEKAVVSLGKVLHINTYNANYYFNAELSHMYSH